MFWPLLFLQEDIKHGVLLIHRPPEPVFDPTNDNVHFMQMPPGTPTGFPVTQFPGQEWGEFDVPLAECFMADVNSALLKELLNLTLAEWESMVEPQGISDHAQRKTMTVGLAVRHRSIAYRA